jgi:glycosyltransferase involved in cell wall biosynthesis
MLQSLSIVTITFNNSEDLINTYKSLEPFRNAGGTHIIVNGGTTIKHLIKNDCILLEEPDRGIYDALNKGIVLVRTPFLMFIHSGDFFVATLNVLHEQLVTINKHQLDILLNNCTIEFGRKKRLMSSKNWRPWMFKFGAQPPHPPIIYRKKALTLFKYDLKHPVIGDFKYLEELFLSNIRWNQGNELLIHMSAGGATSSGTRSFFYVNKQFKKLKGPYKAIWFALTRPIIKVYQMI